MVGLHQSVAERLRKRLGGKWTRKPGKQVCGTIWPNGEFSFAWVPEKVTEVTRGEECSWAMPCPDEDDMASARKKVRSSAYLLQSHFGNRRLTFLTLTVPPLPSRSEEQLLASRWPDATRYFLARLKRELVRHRLPLHVVGVTELQSARYSASGAFCLHLHLCFVGRHRLAGPWCIHPSWFRHAWGEVLEGIVGHSLYLGACENVQMVRRSAEGYLGKYMTKAGAEIEKVREDGNEWMLPRQWWFSTTEMKSWLKRRMSCGHATGQLLDALVYEALMEDTLPEGIWLRPIMVELDQLTLHAGWIGRLTGELKVDIENMRAYTD